MRWVSSRPQHRPRLRAPPELQPLEGRALRSGFTMTSPTTAGALPEEVSPVGGIVLDLVGENGRRVVAQVGASQLFVGVFSDGVPVEYRGNPGTIGVRDGFSPAILDALGGGLAELSIRLTVFDGDSGPGDFDRTDNMLLLNEIPVGRFDAVPTVETDESGTLIRSENPDGGFRNDRLDTGFFLVTDPEILSRLSRSIREEGAVAVQLRDEDPFDNFFDFTLGIDASLIDADLPPTPRNEPPRIDSITVEGSAVEGSPFRVFVAASDPDPGDILSYEFMIENAVDVQVDALPGVPDALVTVPRAGEITLRVRVTDSLGSSAERTRSILVRNVAPIVSSPGVHQAVEGRETPFSLGAFADPGAEDGWTVVVDWGDGSPTESFRVGQPGPLPVRLHRFEQDGDYVIRVSVADGKGSGTASSNVRVRNAPPRIDRMEADRQVDFGQPVSLSAIVSDPSPRDRLAARIDWGDGTVSIVAIPGESNELRAISSYERPGTYAITFTVFDDGGGASSVSLPVVVAAPEAPRLPTFRIDPSPSSTPLFVGDEALAAALLPADRGVSVGTFVAIGSVGATGSAPTIATEPPGKAIGTLVGQAGTRATPRALTSSPVVAPLLSAPTGGLPISPAPAEVASAESERDEAVAISSVEVDNDPPIESVASESSSLDDSFSVVTTEADSPSSSQGANPAGAEENEASAKAMRATVVLIAVLTIRRGGARLRYSRSSGPWRLATR